MPTDDSSPHEPAAPGGADFQLTASGGIGALRRTKHLIFGQPLASSVSLAHRLPIILALPVLASDALSSNAYATEEILLVLASANRYLGGHATLYLLIPISIAIAAMMFIITASYRRAVLLYPQSGGSYTVTHANLGGSAGAVAGAALVIDYILTVAVSVSAGIAAVTSYAPALFPYRVELCLAVILFIAWINLRGTRESGWTFALPAYGFTAMMAILLATFGVQLLSGHVVHAAPPADAVLATQPLSWLLILKAFSNGCAALTGVEAISNGVQIFKPPEASNAAKTLLLLIVTSVVVFLGLGLAAYSYGLVPSHSETLVSQIARAAFLSSGLFSPALGHLLFALTIASVLAVLIIASNTAFADMPRLPAFMARDGYAPRVLMGQGDRLVYNKGIVALTIISAALVVVFQASVNLLIPLYAVGVFLCFTLSQLGMLKRILADRKPGWQSGAVVNALGAAVTGLVTIVIAGSKFVQGAWLIAVLVPLLVFASLAIKRHYRWFEQRMAVRPGDHNPLAGPLDHLTAVVLLSSDIHRGTLEGLEAARAIVEGRKHSALRALHVEIDPEKTKRLQAKFVSLVEPFLGRAIRLDIVPSPYRWLIEPVVDYLNRLELERPQDRIIVVVPEFETGDFFGKLLHNQTASRLRAALMNRPNITLVTQRFFMRPAHPGGPAEKP